MTQKEKALLKQQEALLAAGKQMRQEAIAAGEQYNDSPLYEVTASGLDEGLLTETQDSIVKGGETIEFSDFFLNGARYRHWDSPAKGKTSRMRAEHLADLRAMVGQTVKVLINKEYYQKENKTRFQLAPY